MFHNPARAVPGEQFSGNDINESSGDISSGIHEYEQKIVRIGECVIQIK
jgi:hypothetical protein